MVQLIGPGLGFRQGLHEDGQIRENERIMYFGDVLSEQRHLMVALGRGPGGMKIQEPMLARISHRRTDFLVGCGGFV